MHEVDRQIVADRQFDRHNCQPRPRSTAWIVPSFLTQIIKVTQTGESATISGELHMLRSHHYHKARERGGEYKRLKLPNPAASAAGLGG